MASPSKHPRTPNQQRRSFSNLELHQLSALINGSIKLPVIYHCVSVHGSVMVYG